MYWKSNVTKLNPNAHNEMKANIQSEITPEKHDHFMIILFYTMSWYVLTNTLSLNWMADVLQMAFYTHFFGWKLSFLRKIPHKLVPQGPLDKQ